MTLPWHVADSNPLEDIRKAIKAWENAPMPDPTHVVSREAYEQYMKLYEEGTDGST